MALGNLASAGIGTALGLFNQSQQQMNDYATNYANTFGNYAGPWAYTGTACDPTAITISNQILGIPASVKPKDGRSENLRWLDERIDELRVAL